MNEYEHLKAQVDAHEAREAATKKARLDGVGRKDPEAKRNRA